MICKILLKKPPEDRKFLKLMAKQLNYSGPLGSAEFVISDFDMVAESGNIQVRIIMTRRVSKHIMSTYLPSLCILIIAQVMNFNIFCIFSLD